jgi:lysine 2,3-aminomutase
MKLLTRISELPPALRASISDEERIFIESLEARNLLPFAVTEFYASLSGTDPLDPIRRQCIPSPHEGLRLPLELDDPLGEERYPAAPRLVHQYYDRVLLLAHGTCAGYCRHCFRRVWTSGLRGFVTDRELDAIQAYLGQHPEVQEVLVSGGDPLMGSDERLRALFVRLRQGRPGILLRLGSRVPVMAPERITDALVHLFQEFRPLRLVLHLNHPRELAPPVVQALGSLVSSGIPVHTQTVLLRGVNDSVAVLAELFRSCLTLGLSPYYLFQGDLAPGTAHFRVPLRRALELYRQLGLQISGLALPKFALDLPGGGGKVHLHENSIEDEYVDPSGQRLYRIRGRDGNLWSYPAED